MCVRGQRKQHMFEEGTDRMCEQSVQSHVWKQQVRTATRVVWNRSVQSQVWQPCSRQEVACVKDQNRATRVRVSEQQQLCTG
jgi:hypothetical protein